MIIAEDNSYFKTGKGLRRGDPLSPFLFNLVGDGLSKMLSKEIGKKSCERSLRGFQTRWCSSFDDTIVFSKTGDSALRNLKCVLICYEQISGMRINFHKSELVPLNLEDSEAHRLAHFFSCPLGSFTIKYLGLPLHYDNLSREDVQPLVDKILKKIAGWMGRLISLAARAMLIKSCLASIPVYLLSFIKFPKWAIKFIDTHMRNYLWNDSVDNHKYHLANWELVSMSKERGVWAYLTLEILTLVC